MWYIVEWRDGGILNNYLHTTYLSEVFYIERKFAAETWLFMQKFCHLSLCHNDPMMLDGKYKYTLPLQNGGFEI